ncbi:MAG: hypothetical protein P8173_16020 [Gammaproteobacteria bacterium]
MSHTPNNENSLESLRAQIQSAFPDFSLSGSITGVDGAADEVLDEEQALYSELRGQKWSDIPASFIRDFPDGFLLLTDEAYVAFLAAWLSCALKDAEVREMVVYSLSPDAHKRSNWRGQHIHLLNSSQRKVLQSFLAYCVDIESSKYIKQHAQAALEYVERMKE